MEYSKNTYDFLDVSNVDALINGNIMPTVAPAKETLAPLYYEDLLFLTEGYYQRTYIDTVPRNQNQPPPQTLYVNSLLSTHLYRYGSDIPYATHEITSFNTTTPAIYISQESIISEQPIAKEVFVIHSNVWDDLEEIGALKNYLIPDVLKNYNYNQPTTGTIRTLYSEYIRARYYILNQCSKLLITPELKTFIPTCTYKTYYSSGAIAGEYSFAPTTDMILVTHGYGGPNGYYQSQKTSCTWNQTFAKLNYATACKYICLLEASDFTDSYTKYVVSVPINVDVIADQPIPSLNNIEDYLIQTAANTTGIASNKINVILNQIIPIVDFEFPTTTDFEWQP